MKKAVTKTFREETAGGVINHMVDTQGNYFVDGKCQNPKSNNANPIGYNIPDFDWVEHETDVAKNIQESLEVQSKNQ